MDARSGGRARAALTLLGLVAAGVGCQVVLGLNDAERAAPSVEARTLPDASVIGVGGGGDDAGDAASSFVPPNDPTDAQFVVSSLRDHTCVVNPSKQAFCWGDNTYGQVGDGTVEQRDAPVRVAADRNVTDISAGYTHSCLVTDRNDVYCWGKNDRGQLGDGTKDDRHDPTGKLSMTGGLKVGVGGWHTCALTTLGGVRCWGDNYYGALGDGTFTARTSYVDVKDSQDRALQDVTSLAVGVMHTCAATKMGKVYCWGRGTFGQDGYPVDGGNGSPDPADPGSPYATPVAGLDNIVELASGEDHSCAIRIDGAIFCWGRDDYAEFGNGQNTGGHNVPSRTIEADGGVLGYPRHIAAGKFTTCGVFSSGAVRCWGENNYGQLGNGDFQVGPNVPSPNIANLLNVVRVSTNEHTCAWQRTGDTTAPWKLLCFGRNDLGQLGLGDAGDPELEPRAVTFPPSTP